jgi:hypothetical protein
VPLTGAGAGAGAAVADPFAGVGAGAGVGVGEAEPEPPPVPVTIPAFGSAAIQPTRPGEEKTSAMGHPDLVAEAAAA